jgi:hypothetical protein
MKALTKEGCGRFREWILSLGGAPGSLPPTELLDDRDSSYLVLGSNEIAPRLYAHKFDLAEALLPHIEQLKSLGLSHDTWPEVWNGLALRHFDSICPQTPEGLWKPNRIEHYIYDPSYTVRHRHRIYGPVTLLQAGGTHIRPFFKTAPSVLGDFEEQVGSRQELAGNPTALRVLAALYVENGTDKLISGYTNRKSYKGFKAKLPLPGSLRRFTAIYDQLKRTYDLAGISFEGFVEVLPAEFREWLEY